MSGKGLRMTIDDRALDHGGILKGDVIACLLHLLLGLINYYIITSEIMVFMYKTH